MKPLKHRVSITLDTDVIEKLKILAEDNDRSLSQYINLILKEYLLSHNLYCCLLYTSLENLSCEIEIIPEDE